MKDKKLVSLIKERHLILKSDLMSLKKRKDEVISPELLTDEEIKPDLCIHYGNRIEKVDHL